MKILVALTYYKPYISGLTIYAARVAEAWAKAGHEVTVVTCPPNVPNGVVYDGYANARTSETINGVRVERVKLYIAANKGAVKRMFNFVSYFFKALMAALRLSKPDVVIATSPQIFCGYAGVWYKRLRHVPLVIEIRDIWPESMGAVGARIPKFAYWMLEKIERAMYRTCDRLVTVGEGYKARLIEKGVPEEKIAIVMNGTDLAVYRPLPKNEALLEKYGLKGKFVVSYIGTVGMACGLEVVLDAAEVLDRINRIDRIEWGKENNPENPVNPVRKEIVFAIVGDGAYREKLEAEAKRRGLKNVVFTGRQPKDSMPDWINASDASLVHLKKTELFTTVMPSKIFESAGCKKPIIMGVDGYAKKLVMEAEAGLDMTPESAESLVACVKKLADDDALCRQLGENAYNNIAKVHNRDKQAEEYLDILRQD